MIIMIVLIILIVAGCKFIGADNQSEYEEYCNLECWSRRKPCCRTQ